MGSVRRTVRLTQSVVPFGVGAIYDVFGESFVACDITRWGANGKRITSRALQQQLNVDSLRRPPSVEELYFGIPYQRFPMWLFCQRCRQLSRWSKTQERPDEPAICQSCNGVRKLVPMRFIVACKNGHLSDVPWALWAHSGGKSSEVRCRQQILRFKGRPGGSSGLSSLIVECDRCKTSRSLAGLTTKDSLAKLHVSCTGTQPWQFANAEACDQVPQVVQRGASNIYFADVASALEIPIADGFGAFDELRTAVEGHPAYSILRHIIDEQGVSALTGPMAAGLLTMMSTELAKPIEHISTIVTGQASDPLDPDHASREWLALTSPQVDEQDPRSPFITRHVSLSEDVISDPWLSTVNGSIKHVVLVTRLKEVRALRSFSRLDPLNRSLRPDLTPTSISPKVSWAPAVEVFGEGIFLAFDEATMAAWESSTVVNKRVSKLQNNLTNSGLGKSILKQRLGRETASARFVFLHTLAHLLIRELCFECGYSSASIRERIYSEPGSTGPQAGLLIFTAAGDAEGTLGGLVRQGRPPRLLRSLAKALEAGTWCSADPICHESHGQGYDDTNLAACHACSLLPETSCVTGNMLLDRSLVVDRGERSSGFFPNLAGLMKGSA